MVWVPTIIEEASMFRKFLKDQSGASAVEFSLVAIPLFLTIFANLELGVKSIQQSELDAKMSAVASKLSLSAEPANSAIDFINGTFCQDIGTTMLNCSKVTIGAVTVANSARMINLQNQSIIGQWDLGCNGETVLIEVNYPVSNITHPIAIGDVVERGDSDFFRSRAVIRREPVLASKGGATC